MSFPGVQDLITDYQRRAKGTPADKLGYYVLGSAAIVRSTDRAGAVSRFAAIFGAPPLHEFQIDGRDLSVSVFPQSGPLASWLRQRADTSSTGTSRSVGRRAQ